jgi:hypothetical protein
MLAAELSVLPTTDQRKAPRRIVNLAAALREEGATISAVKVLDISLGGCRLETEADLEVGGQVWLKLPGLETKRSRIVWTQGRHGGCEFDVPLHPAELDLLMPRRVLSKASDVFRRF